MKQKKKKAYLIYFDLEEDKELMKYLQTPPYGVSRQGFIRQILTEHMNQNKKTVKKNIEKESIDIIPEKTAKKHITTENVQLFQEEKEIRNINEEKNDDQEEKKEFDLTEIMKLSE